MVFVFAVNLSVCTCKEEKNRILDGKGFELAQLTHELLIKSEEKRALGMQNVKIKVEEEFLSMEFEGTQINQEFIKYESDQFSNTCGIVPDRIYNASETMANFDSTDMKELNRDTDNNKHQVTENGDQIIINNENTEYRLMNPNTESVLTSSSTANRRDPTEPLIKCEATDEVKVENDSDIDTSGITSINEEYIIKNEHDDDAGSIDSVSSKSHKRTQITAKNKLTQQRLKYTVSGESYKLFMCIYCKNTFKFKIGLDNHMIKKHPEHTALISSKLHECKRCAYKTTIKSGLDNHIIKNHPEYMALVSNKIHECKHCTFKTNSKSKLCKHMGKHPGEESSCELKACIHCNATFKIKIGLDNHIIKKHPEHIGSVSSKIHDCTYCTYKSTIKKELTRHMLNHSGVDGKLSVCIHCDASFSSERTLNDHILKKHPEYIASVSNNILECTHCTYKTTIKSLLDNHIVKNHPEYVALVSSKVHECKHCKFKTMSKSKLRNHMGKHPGAERSCELKACIHCNAKFKNKTTLDNHIIEKHSEYIESVSSKIHECKYCSFKTTLKDRLAIHMGKHPGVEGGCERKTCIHCNATFTCKKSLDDHTIKKHPEYIASVSSKIHGCNYCVFKTTSKRDLDRHIRKHEAADGDLKTCIHCNATFEHNATLDNHIIEKHPEFIASVSKNIYECTSCIYKTTINREFSEHMLNHSVKEVKLENDLDADTSGIGITEQYIIKNASVSSETSEYGQSTAKYKLTKQVLTYPVTNESCKPLVCVHCNMTLKSKRGLDNHVIKKHPECIASVSSKIHECTHCTYKTIRNIELTRHMLNHSRVDGKLNVCIHCNLTFRSKRTLNNHIFNQHPENMHDHMIKNHPEYIALVSNKIHECKHCKFKTISKDILRRHLREQPGAEGGCPLVTCIHCNARFKDKTTLDNHIIKNHPEHIAPQEHCLFKATLKNRLAILMGSHPEGDCEPKNDFSKHMLEHPVEKVKLENDLDTENCGITIITEEYIIKNDDDDDGSITSVSSKT